MEIGILRESNHIIDWIFQQPLLQSPKARKNLDLTVVISVYNVYNRKNTFFIYYDTETNVEL